MLKFLKELLCVVRTYRKSVADLEKAVADLRVSNSALNVRCHALEQTLKRALEDNYDVDRLGGCWIISIGKFRGHDYVSIDNVDCSDFSEVVRMVRERSITRRTGRVDLPPDCREFFDYAKAKLF